MSDTDEDDFDRQIRRINTYRSQLARRFMRWLQKAVGSLGENNDRLALIIAGLFGFLPVIGWWMLPFGMLSQNLPLLKPLARRILLWFDRRRRKEGPIGSGGHAYRKRPAPIGFFPPK